MKRHVCTEKEPWDEAKHGEYAEHPDAIDVGQSSDGTVDWFRCPHCNAKFKVEAAR